MKELLEYIAKWLVKDPSQVSVTELQSSSAVIFELSVAPEDMGHVIGRRGSAVNAIRTLLRAAAGRQGKHVMLFVCPPS